MQQQQLIFLNTTLFRQHPSCSARRAESRNIRNGCFSSLAPRLGHGWAGGVSGARPGKRNTVRTLCPYNNLFSDLRIVLLLMTAVSGLSSTNLAGLFWTKLGHQHQIFTGDFDEKFGPVPGVVWRGVLDDDTGPSCDVV